MAESFGRYTLLRSLGHGDMADVWKAVLRGPSEFRKAFALKVLLQELSAGRDFVEVFVEEARLLGSLAHPNIVQVTDFGDVGGRVYVATEFVHGKDLDAISKRLASKGARLPFEIALAIGVDLVRALGAAHARTGPDGHPVLHREVFPKNVIVSYLGDVKLTDFRSARVRSVAPAKLVYRSPEQSRGDALDRRSDLFSAALLVLDLATGFRPAEGTSPPRDTAAFAFPEKEASFLPPPAQAVLRKALALDRNQRFAEASELEAAFTDLLGGKGLLEARRTLRTTMERLFADEIRAESAEDPAAPLPPSTVSAPQPAIVRDTVSVPLLPRKRPTGERPAVPPEAARVPALPAPSMTTAPGLGEAAMETGAGAPPFAPKAPFDEAGTADSELPIGARGAAAPSPASSNPFEDIVEEGTRRAEVRTRVAAPADDLSRSVVPGKPTPEPSRAFSDDLFPKPKGSRVPLTAVLTGAGAVLAGIVGFVLVDRFVGAPGAPAADPMGTAMATAVAQGDATPAPDGATPAPDDPEPARTTIARATPTPAAARTTAPRAAPTATAMAVARTPTPARTPASTPVIARTPPPTPRPTPTAVVVRTPTPRPTPTRPAATPAPTTVAVATGPMGELSVKSNPFVIVWLDGKKLKATPIFQKVTAGPHKVRFTNDEEEVDLVKDIHVPENGRVTIDIDLDTGKIEVRGSK